MLSAPAEVVLSYLTGLAPVGATIEPTFQTLCADLGYTQKTSVYNALSELISQGYVRRISSGGNGKLGVLTVKRRHSPSKPIDLDSRLREQLEILQEENRQLRERVSELSGQRHVERARIVFDLTPKQAKLLVLLMARGVASRGLILDTLYDADRLATLEDGYQALGALIKYLRKALSKHQIEIATVYGSGWRMSDSDRLRVRALVEGRA